MSSAKRSKKATRKEKAENQSRTPISTKSSESGSRKENIVKTQNGTPTSTPMRKKSVLSLAKKSLKNGTPSANSKSGN